MFNLLSMPTLRVELAGLTHKLKQPGIKLGIKAVYGHTFSRMADNLRQAQALNVDIQAMLSASFRDLNTEFSFSLQTPKVPELTRYENDLKTLERSHLQYLGVNNVLKLTQPEFTERLVRALATRLRVVFEGALGEVELWNKSAVAQLDAQLRERRRNFGRRLEAIDRIRKAASGLDELIAEIVEQEVAVDVLDRKLGELTADLFDGLGANSPKSAVSLPEPAVMAVRFSGGGGPVNEMAKSSVDVDAAISASDDADLDSRFDRSNRNDLSDDGQSDTVRSPLAAA